MGYDIKDVEESLKQGKYNDITANYLLLGRNQESKVRFVRVSRQIVAHVTLNVLLIISKYIDFCLLDYILLILAITAGCFFCYYNSIQLMNAGWVWGQWSPNVGGTKSSYHTASGTSEPLPGKHDASVGQ